MTDLTDHYRGLAVLAPSHLAGARVISACVDDYGPEWDRDVELVLDRRHPTEPGYVGVILDDVILDVGEA